MNCNINSETISKLYKKMEKEGVTKTISVETYINNILNETVKDIKLETKPLPKAKACKRMF